LVLANEHFRPIDISEIDPNSTVEYANRIEGLSANDVVFLDREAINRDFPQLRGLSDQEVKELLIRDFGYIGSDQHNLSGIRSSEFRIKTSDQRPAYRPNGWNRAALLEVRDPSGNPIGLIDVKGIGHGNRTSELVRSQVERFRDARGNENIINILRTRDHSDGLMSLGEAIAETTRQRAAQMLFNTSVVPNRVNYIPLETVETYAVIRLPFDILKDNNTRIPAALYLRQAHVGRNDMLNVPESIYVDIHGDRQMTRTGTAVDFGGVMIQDQRVLPNFRANNGSLDPQKSNAWIWGHETAEAIADGRIRNFNDHLHEMIGPLLAGYEQNSREHRQISETVARFVQEQRSNGLSLDEIVERLAEWRRTQPFILNYAEATLKSYNPNIRQLAVGALQGNQSERA
ncbi:MAG: hypothetical protein AB1478_12305, partial [Nitrospirota bacterium]